MCLSNGLTVDDVYTFYLSRWIDPQHDEIYYIGRQTAYIDTFSKFFISNVMKLSADDGLLVNLGIYLVDFTVRGLSHLQGNYR